MFLKKDNKKKKTLEKENEDQDEKNEYRLVRMISLELEDDIIRLELSNHNNELEEVLYRRSTQPIGSGHSSKVYKLLTPHSSILIISNLCA